MLQVAQRVNLQALLDKPVEFVRASRPFGHSLPNVSTRTELPSSNERAIASPSQDALAMPRKVLFPPNALTRSWSKIMSAPAGLYNTGNTCFLNAVLQLLMHVPALVLFLQSGQHGQDCRLNHCVFCKLEEHTRKAYPANGIKRGQPFRPAYAQNIKQIGKQFKTGRQEDAHEFLLLLLEQLQQSSLQGQPKTLDHRSKETTVVHRAFGGHLRQQITCSGCREPSSTYEATLVLSIDCLSTIDQGLARLTTPEILAGKNRYKCEKCKKLQEARKQTTIYHAPENLIIHLKRFQFAVKSSKVSRPVAFEDTLDISRYMTPGRPPVQYQLAGVVVHQGSGVSSGHYYAFGKGSNSVWHEFNDASVSQVGFDRVKRQQAYLLCYTKSDRKLAAGRHSTPDVVDKHIKTNIGRDKSNDMAAGSFEQLTGGNFKKRKHAGALKEGSDHKKKRIFAQMRNKHGR